MVDKDTTKSINKIRARAIQVTIYATSTNVFFYFVTFQRFLKLYLNVLFTSMLTPSRAQNPLTGTVHVIINVGRGSGSRRSY